MQQRLSFQQLKEKVGIDDVAYFLGYRLNKKAGVGKYFELVLLNDDGTAADKIVIRNTPQKQDQHFFSRYGSHSGDVIDFIQNHINSFFETGTNDWDKIRKILMRFANMPEAPTAERWQKIKQSGQQIKTFDKTKYDAHKICAFDDLSFFQTRALDADTILRFSPYIYIVRKADKEQTMIGFPYTRAGEEEVRGYELRGPEGLKLKAAGTDSTNCAWIADLAPTIAPTAKTHVYFAESALDVMALYQQKQQEIDVEHAVFVSTGGTFSPQQIKNVMQHYARAEAVDCFDNDLAGRIYGIRMAALLWDVDVQIRTEDGRVIIEFDGQTLNVAEKACTLPYFRKKARKRGKVSQMKAPAAFKDWNDVIMHNG